MPHALNNFIVSFPSFSVQMEISMESLAWPMLASLSQPAHASFLTLLSAD